MLLSIHFGAIAQLGERLHGMQEVVGSNPIGSISTNPGLCKNIWFFLAMILPFAVCSVRIGENSEIWGQLPFSPRFYLTIIIRCSIIHN